MRKEVILSSIFVVGLIYLIIAAIYSKTTGKVKEVKTQTIENVKVEKITERLPWGMCKVNVSDTLQVLVYSDPNGTTMIRIK